MPFREAATSVSMGVSGFAGGISASFEEAQRAMYGEFAGPEMTQDVQRRMFRYAQGGGGGAAMRGLTGAEAIRRYMGEGSMTRRAGRWIGETFGGLGDMGVFGGTPEGIAQNLQTAQGLQGLAGDVLPARLKIGYAAELERRGGLDLSAQAGTFADVAMRSGGEKILGQILGKLGEMKNLDETQKESLTAIRQLGERGETRQALVVAGAAFGQEVAGMVPGMSMRRPGDFMGDLALSMGLQGMGGVSPAQQAMDLRRNQRVTEAFFAGDQKGVRGIKSGGYGMLGPAALALKQTWAKFTDSLLERQLVEDDTGPMYEALQAFGRPAASREDLEEFLQPRTGKEGLTPRMTLLMTTIGFGAAQERLQEMTRASGPEQVAYLRGIRGQARAARGLMGGTGSNDLEAYLGGWTPAAGTENVGKLAIEVQKLHKDALGEILEVGITAKEEPALQELGGSSRGFYNIQSRAQELRRLAKDTDRDSQKAFKTGLTRFAADVGFYEPTKMKELEGIFRGTERTIEAGTTMEMLRNFMLQGMPGLGVAAGDASGSLGQFGTAVDIVTDKLGKLSTALDGGPHQPSDD